MMELVRLPETPRPPRLSRAGIIAGLYGGLALLAVGVGLLRGDPDVWRGPGATPLKMLLSPLVGLGVGLLVVFLSRWATHRLQWARVLHDEFQAVLGELTPREIFLLAAFSSVGEEMFFRGALLPIVGLGWSSLVFALLPVAAGAAHAQSDLTLWRDGDSHVTPTIRIDSGFFAESNAWFGEGEANAGDHVDYWGEFGVVPGLEGALSLGRPGKLTLFESDKPAVAAVDAAARKLGGNRVVAARRDLFRNPLTTAELDGFDALVLDPPRAGAAAQCAEIARSKVKKIVYGSCDPGSFARDARTLQEGGYRLEKLMPIDQFLWSAHVELVALLTK